MFYSGMPGKEMLADEPLTDLMDKNVDAFFIVKVQAYKKLPVALPDKVKVLTTYEDKILLVRKGSN